MLLRNLGEVYKKGTRIMSNLYNRIETLCKENNESITTMCKASGASRASLSDLKVGRKQNLSAETLSKIAAHFGVSVDYLLGKTDLRLVALFENVGGMSKLQKENSPTEQTLDEGTQKLISAILDLPPEKQKALADLIGIDY